MGLPLSQHPAPGPVAPPTGVLAPPEAAPGAAPVVVAVDEGDRAPGLRAPPDDIAGDVAVVGWPPLTRSCNTKKAKIEKKNCIKVSEKAFFCIFCKKCRVLPVREAISRVKWSTSHTCYRMHYSRTSVNYQHSSGTAYFPHFFHNIHYRPGV